MKSYLTLILAACLSTGLVANNIRVFNLEILSQNTSEQTYTLQFDLAWENSWRTNTFESNWDAAWVFVKFTPQNQQAWSHAELLVDSGDPILDGHSVPGGATIDIPSDGVGCFIYRSSDGSGDFIATGVQLVWDYSNESIGDSDAVDVTVHAVEMVYITPGGFYLGDGSGENLAFRDGSTDSPVYVDDEEVALQLGGSAGISNGAPSGAGDAANGDDFNSTQTRTLPAAWPLGVHGYYVMKYEVTRRQYGRFLEQVTELQRSTLVPLCQLADNSYISLKEYANLPGFSHRPFDAVGNHYADANYPYYPMNCLNWDQKAAYLDWAGMRPLSETEFEKACRGPLNPVPEELAWGNTDAYMPMDVEDGPYFPYSIDNVGTATEVITGWFPEDHGNLFYPFENIYVEELCPTCTKSGLGRVGSIAGSIANPTRTNTGATYFGLMEMSGNAYETVITLSNDQTRDFTGMHGDGEIGFLGTPSSELYGDWCGPAADGVGMKRNLVSERMPGPFESSNVRYSGLRGCRTAP